MRRIMMLVLGAGLFALWIIEVQLPGTTTGSAFEEHYSTATAWITWLDLVAALGAVFAAAPIIMKATRWAGLLSVGLIAMGAVALVSTAPTWMGLWNLAFGMAFGAMALASNKLGKAENALPERKVRLSDGDHIKAA